MNSAQALHKTEDVAPLRAIKDEINKSFSVRNKGGDPGVLFDGQLAPTGKEIIIDGKPLANDDLIPGIESIQLTFNEGLIFDFELQVVGQCPHDKGHIRMSFTDDSGDSYDLSIYSRTKKVHTLKYDSPDGCINKITWSFK